MVTEESRNSICTLSLMVKTVKNQPTCFYCGKIVENKNKKYRKKFCSTDCQYDMYVETSEGKAGIDAIRSYLHRKKKGKCDYCGIDRWMDNEISLEVHHINGNWIDNSLENLLLLCPNCHSQTDNFKAKNKGNGREARRKHAP